MDIEGEEEEASAILAEPRVCICPGFITHAAESQGVTCQRLFERAMLREGKGAIFARAVFVRFIGTPKRDNLIPAPVREYCSRIANMNLENKTGKRSGFCVACMIDPKAWYGLLLSYSMIHPEVNEEYLIALASARTRKGESAKTELDEVEKLFLDILDSGALTGEENDWTGLVPDEGDLT